VQRNLAKLGRFGKTRHEHLKEAEELAKQHTAEPYGPHRHIFSVRGKGGTSMDEERYSGQNYRGDLDKVECSCIVPQIMHAPCFVDMTTPLCHICHPCISIQTPLVFGTRASSHTSTRRSGPLVMVLSTCRIQT
jgi:hypothetical protein